MPFLRQHLGRAHHQLRGVDLAGQPGLGQRRPVVGAERLVAQHRDGRGVAARTQRFGGLHAGLAGPDDDACCFVHSCDSGSVTVSPSSAARP
jgi:hypothetical protein